MVPGEETFAADQHIEIRDGHDDDTEYENSFGTGQVHLWFDRPANRFPRPRRTHIGAITAEQPFMHDAGVARFMTEHRRILLDGAEVEVVRNGENLIAGDGRMVAIADAHICPRWYPRKSLPCI